MSKKSKSERIPSAGENFKEESSVVYVKRGHHDTGSPRNSGLRLPDKAWQRSDRNEDSFSSVPEYSEKQAGGRSKNHLEVPASKRRNAVQSNPQGAGPDTTPDNSHEKSTSGPRHPGKGVTGASPRHDIRKIVTSTPDAAPRMPASKNSSDTSDTVRGKGYGNRAPVSESPRIRKRSDVVPSDSSMVHDDHNSKKRAGSGYDGIGRKSLKDREK